jgi:sarcosine oxidase subunit beta
MVMWGYASNARRMGVRFCEGVRATGIDAHKGRVRDVLTDRGRIATGTVVNAAGPWAIEVGRWVDVEIPIINSARNILVTGPFPHIPSDRPFVYDVTVEWYCRPEGPGILMGMGAEPVEDLDVQFSLDVLDEMIDTAIHRIPVLEKASLLTGWTGIRPMTMDDHPIVGPAPSVAGLILNCGWGGKGIMEAPLAGQLVAELVDLGETVTMEIEPFRIERFEGQSTAEVTDLRVYARRI